MCTENETDYKTVMIKWFLAMKKQREPVWK